MPTERRTKWLKVRLTPTENTNLVRISEAAGVSRSALVRDHIGKVVIVNREDERARVREIARIGSNLNQLARWANTYKRAAEALPILRALRTIQADVLALRSVDDPADQEETPWRS